MVGIRNTCSSEEFEAFWPHWRKDNNIKTVVDCEISCPVDTLYQIFFYPGHQFQTQAHIDRNHLDVAETGWVDNFYDLPSLPNGYDWATEHGTKRWSHNKPLPESMRKVRMTCPGNKFHPASFQTEEMQRVIRYDPSKVAIVDSCVISTPFLCDKFRTIVRYSIERFSTNTCRLQIQYQIVYVSDVNFLAKSFIHKSCHGGITQSFQKMMRTLDKYVTISDLAHINKEIPCSATKDIKSHKLDDVPLEIFEDDEIITPKSTKTSASPQFLLVLFVAQCFLALFSICHFLLLRLPMRILSTWKSLFKFIIGVVLAYVFLSYFCSNGYIQNNDQLPVSLYPPITPLKTLSESLLTFQPNNLPDAVEIDSMKMWFSTSCIFILSCLMAHIIINLNVFISSAT